MRVVFLALRKGMTPLFAGLLVGRHPERTGWRGRDKGGTFSAANSIYAAFRDECSPIVLTAKTPDKHCCAVIRWYR